MASRRDRAERRTQYLRAAGFDELSRALQIGRGDEDLARPATPRRFPGAGTDVGLSVVAGDSLGPQETTDRRGLDRVADNGEPNSEHRDNSTDEPT